MSEQEIELPKYDGREGRGTFRPMTFEEAAALPSGGHAWIRTVTGDARRVKINGAPKRWKRDPGRIEVPIKYGMYEYARFNRDDIDHDRLLVEVLPECTCDNERDRNCEIHGG